MKKALLISLLLIILVFVTGCSQHMARNWGGEMTIELNPNESLELITWKEDSLWILTKERPADVAPITHTFQESTDWNVFEGTIYIVEK